MSINTLELFSKAIKNDSILTTLATLSKDLNFSLFQYEGFDAAHLMKIMFEKAVVKDSEKPISVIADACAIGYYRGNIHKSSQKRTSDRGSTRIDELVKVFNIKQRADGKAMQGNPGKDGITFVRFTAVFPYIVCQLLYQGSDGHGLSPRVVIGNWEVNSLPNPCRFTNFLSCAYGLLSNHKKEWYTFSVAWMAWQTCFLHQILRTDAEKKALTWEHMRNQVDLVHHNNTISSEASLEFLKHWQLWKNDKIPEIVIVIAHNYMKAMKQSDDEIKAKILEKGSGFQ